jgi:hypothetical protein
MSPDEQLKALRDRLASRSDVVMEGDINKGSITAISRPDNVGTGTEPYHGGYRGERASSRPPTDRITVRCEIFHQQHNQPITSHGTRFERKIKNPEQAWTRRKVIGTDWELFDLGFLAGKELSLIAINNVSDDSKVKVKIGENGGSSIVHPNETYFCCPEDGFSVYISSEKEQSLVVLHAFPA